MLVDFHCHTLATKKGENKNRNLSEKDIDIFLKNASDSNVGVIAITNHNHFDKKQFNLLIEHNKEGKILILPGIELDILDCNGDIFNFNFLGDSKKVDDFEKMIFEIVGDQTPDSFIGIGIKKLGEILNKFNFQKIGLIPTPSKRNNNKKIFNTQDRDKLIEIFNSNLHYYKFELGKNSVNYERRTQTIFEKNNLAFTVGTENKQP